MQSRIDSLLQRHASKNRQSLVSISSANLSDYHTGFTHEANLVTYKRRREDPTVNEERLVDEDDEEDEPLDIVKGSSTKLKNLMEGEVPDTESNYTGCFMDVFEDSPHEPDKSFDNKVLNKKRNYAQCFLELGQSNFLLHRCPTCGMEYTCGDADDEKLHRSFHDNHQHGIPFKSWVNEKVLFVDRDTGDRIIRVVDDDHPSHKHKVLQLAGLLERDLSLTNGWLLHKLCKVYMFISGNRVVGCVFTEPIKTAHKIIPRTSPPSKACPVTKPTRSNQHILQFGNITFMRETIKRALSPRSSEVIINDSGGAIFCEEEPVIAECGIRAIWVAPSKRRRGIASKLLNAVRENFGEHGSTIELSKLAFSQPTSAGKGFASAYIGSGPVLVYNP